MNTNQIEIPFSKQKTILLIIAGVLFCAIGIFFILKPTNFSDRLLDSTLLVQALGIVSILLFGAITISLIKKINSKEPGMIINSVGITDNASAVSAGLIYWKDIIDIRINSVRNQRFLMIITKNPQLYIDRQNGFFKRKSMQMNYKFYGSPISISANALQMDFDSLYQTVIEKYNNYKEAVL